MSDEANDNVKRAFEALVAAVNWTHDYVAYCKCGQIVAVIADVSTDRRDVGDAVGRWIRDGYTVERVSMQWLNENREQLFGCKCEKQQKLF